MPKPSCGSSNPLKNAHCGQPSGHKGNCTPSGGYAHAAWAHPDCICDQGYNLDKIAGCKVHGTPVGEIDPMDVPVKLLATGIVNGEMVTREIVATPRQLAEPYTLKNKDLSKYGEHEPLFVIRGRDLSAPALLRGWLIANPQISAERRAEVERCIIAMQHYPKRRKAD